MDAHDLLSELAFALSAQSAQDLAVLAAAAFIAGLARGFSGFGAALIFMPLASVVVGPQIAAPLLLVVDAVAALGLIPDAWRRSDRRDVGMMAIGAVIGIPLGTAALALADPLVVRWGIVATVAALLVLLASGWRYHGQPKASLTIGVGALSGLFAGAAQIGGPPVVAYWLGGAIESAKARANIVLYFAISTVLTGISYSVGGLITKQVLALAVIIGPLYGVGLYLGSRLFGRAKERTFRWVCYGLIASAAIIGLPLFDSPVR